jgi:hypothetical protein
MYAARDIRESNNPAQFSADLRQLWADASAPILELLHAQKLCIVEHDFTRSSAAWFTSVPTRT